VPAPEFSRTLEKGAWEANAAKPPLLLLRFKEEAALKKYFLIVLIIFICYDRIWAGGNEGKIRIEINIPSHTLKLYKDDTLMKEYPVCLGKRPTPTPEGEYRVIYKTINPYWINKDVVVPPGPRNPLGARWIGISKKIGIHGNNKPESIGTYASAGCIRMYNRDAEELYALVPLDTPVAVKYDRSEVFEDKYSGERAVIIYPDSYKKGPGNCGQLLDKLRRLDIYEELINRAQEILKRTTGKPLTASKGIGVFLNNSLMTCDALEEKDCIFINRKAAEDILGLIPGIAGLFDIGIKEAEGKVYINLTQTVKCLGGSITYDKAGDAYINMKIIKINGVFAGINYGNYDKSDLLSVEAVKQLGYEYTEDSVDIRIFDKGIIKLIRNNTWVVNADNLAKATGGFKNVSSRDGIVDMELPVFLKIGEEYYKIDSIDGRLVLNADTACSIYERSGLDVKDEDVDLETFLKDYEYETNYFGTVIEIKAEGN